MEKIGLIFYFGVDVKLKEKILHADILHMCHLDSDNAFSSGHINCEMLTWNVRLKVKTLLFINTRFVLNS